MRVQIKLKDFRRDTEAAMELLKIPKRVLESLPERRASRAARRSGCEILQMAMLKPRLAVLDETDSGLDIDALQTVAERGQRDAGPDLGVLIITHYQRILHLVKPDFVHVISTGGSSSRAAPSWSTQLEQKGYGWIRDEVEAAA